MQLATIIKGPKWPQTTGAQQLGDTLSRIPACTGHQHKHIQVDAVTARVPAIGTLVQQYSTATPCNDISIAAGGPTASSLRPGTVWQAVCNDSMTVIMHTIHAYSTDVHQHTS